ncbi:MAG: energy transducer TonB [Pontixanthobacter sp.]
MLQPSMPWQMNYADDSCRLARLFGEGDDASAFYIERYVPGDGLFLLIAGKPFDGSERRTTKITFGPEGRTREQTGPYGEFGNFRPAIFVSNMSLAPLPTEQPGDDVDRSGKAAKSFNAFETPAPFSQYLTEDQERSVSWIQVQRGGKAPVRLILGPMGEPMKAMRACTDDMVARWGIDVEAHRTLMRSVEPTENPGNWMSSRDYPIGLLRSGEQGLVQFRLMVDTDGNATDCHIQRSTRPEGFDRAVCRAMMKRADFEPALDATGTPIASYYRSTIRFVML